MTSTSGHRDDWTLLQKQHEGFPLLVRFRQFTHDFDRAAYPTRMNVIWSMHDADENGLPTSTEISMLEVFENRLVTALEGHSVLSVVLTFGSEREFVFHTRDPDGFIERLTAMPQEAERYPIEIHSAQDPAWDYDAAVTTPA